MGEFSSGIGRVDCRSCRAVCKDAGVPTQCETCFPGVHPYNSLAYTCYCHCSSQYIIGPSGAVALNSLAMDLVFERMNIVLEDRLELDRKIQTIAISCISAHHSEAEKTKK